MSDPIRPPAWPQATGVTPARPDPRREAQRAFFQQALGRSGASSTPAAPAAAQTPAVIAQPAAGPPRQRVDLKIDLPPEPGGKILRPGSIIDIKV